MSTWWRGVLLDDRSAAMMAEVATLTGPTVEPSQGSYSTSVGASAGTHSGPGAIDLAAEQLTPAQRDELVAAMRQVGWAAWLRTPAQGFSYHVHGIAVGCDGLPPAAAAQVADYFAGRNGLVSRAPDDGPRQWVGVTWESYLAAKPKPMPPPVWFPTGDVMEPTVFTIVTDQGADAGQWFAAAGNVMFQPLDNSCNEKNGWKQVRVTRKQFDVIYARHCTVNRLDPQTYTAL